MPKVTGLSNDEMQTLNNTLESLLQKGMEAFEERVDTKAERVAFKAATMSIKMAEHLPIATRLGYLVEGSNKILPKLSKYFNTEAIGEFIPAELKTQQMADLCEKAGAKPLADILRKVAAPAPVAAATTTTADATAQAGATAAKVVKRTDGFRSDAPVVSEANLQIASTPVIPAGPGGR